LDWIASRRAQPCHRSWSFSGNLMIMLMERIMNLRFMIYSYFLFHNNCVIVSVLMRTCLLLWDEILQINKIWLHVLQTSIWESVNEQIWFDNKPQYQHRCLRCCPEWIHQVSHQLLSACWVIISFTIISFMYECRHHAPPGCFVWSIKHIENLKKNHPRAQI
jgi:hypothetical protein